MHATVKFEKYPIVTNPQPVAIRMIGEFLDTLAIRKISQRLNFGKNSFAHGGCLNFLNLLKRFRFPINVIHTYYYKPKISIQQKYKNSDLCETLFLEILQRALYLRSPHCCGWHFNDTHGVAFFTELHGHLPRYNE